MAKLTETDEHEMTGEDNPSYPIDPSFLKYNPRDNEDEDNSEDDDDEEDKKKKKGGCCGGNSS